MDAARDDLYLIDASAPFFVDDGGGKTNWSKIAFAELEEGGKVRKRTRQEVVERFEAYARTVRGLGYNAVSLDDLAHVVKFRFYPRELKRKLEGYRKLYRDLLDVCAREGLRVFLNTDLMFRLAGLESVPRGGRSRTAQVVHHLCKGLRKTFDRYPEVEGVIFRLGECDGIDVMDADFRSRLFIMDPATGNRILGVLLRLLRRRGRKMVVRTWTVGAYRVGDLMWNQATFERLFRGLEDPCFFVSMKYGDTDFFKFVELNPMFFAGRHQKLIELQARREYEGFGCFPNYVGFDYQRYRDQVRDAPGLRGVMVWCQTGGWSHFRNVTFGRDSSVWNELNTYACLRLFRDGWSGEQAIRGFCREHRPELDADGLVRLARDADEVLAGLWYLPGYSRQVLYFRRVRVPPLLWVFWDTIVVNHALRKVLRRLVPEPESWIADGYRHLDTIRAMRPLAERVGLDPAAIDFQLATFELLAVARDYFLAEDHRPAQERLRACVAEYVERYPDGFRVEMSFAALNVRRSVLQVLLRVFTRRRAGYRLVDRLALNLLTRVLYPLGRRLHLRRLPEIARTQAMGIEAIFR